MPRERWGISLTWGINEQPGKKVFLVEVRPEENYVKCLVTAFISMRIERKAKAKIKEISLEIY